MRRQGDFSSWVGRLSGSALPWVPFLAVSVAWVFSTRLELPSWPARASLQNAILEGSATEPYRFRLLVPSIAQTIEDGLLALAISPAQAHQATYLLLNTVFISAAMIGLLKHLDQSSLLAQILSIWLLAGSLHIALYDHAYQPWTLLELPLVVWGFFFYFRGKFGWLPLIALVSSLNRDTGFLLPLSIIGLAFLSRARLTLRQWALLVGSLVTGLVTMFSLRLALGRSEVDITLTEIVAINTTATGLRQFIFNLTLMLGFGWWVFLSSSVGRLHQLTLLSLAPYLVASAIFGIWYEVRLLLPVAWVVVLVISERLDHISFTLQQSRGAET